MVIRRRLSSQPQSSELFHTFSFEPPARGKWKGHSSRVPPTGLQELDTCPEATPWLERIADSKKLTEANREAIFEWLTHTPSVRYAVQRVDAARIDEINILQVIPGLPPLSPCLAASSSPPPRPPSPQLVVNAFAILCILALPSSSPQTSCINSACLQAVLPTHPHIHSPTHSPH